MCIYNSKYKQSSCGLNIRSYHFIITCTNWYACQGVNTNQVSYKSNIRIAFALLKKGFFTTHYYKKGI